jgi:hypothetical protein
MLRAGMIKQQAAGHLFLAAARLQGAEEDRADRREEQNRAGAIPL